MELQLIRKEFTQHSTIGELSVNGKLECYTLEDVVRLVKIKGMTAVPAGAYEVVVTFSERFQRLLPLLLNVPGFDGIRIHTGNTDRDTEGCILVGKVKGKDAIKSSKRAFDALFPKIRAAAQREKIFIQILEERPDTQ